MPRTQSDYEQSFTFKMFAFQVNIIILDVDDDFHDDDGNRDDVGDEKNVGKDGDNDVSISVHQLLCLPHLHRLLQGEEQTSDQFNKQTFLDIYLDEFCISYS